MVLLVVARRPEQYKHEPGWYRDLGDVAEQRSLLQPNERVQRTRQTLDVSHQYVRRLGAGRYLLEKMLVVLHTHANAQAILIGTSLYEEFHWRYVSLVVVLWCPALSSS